MRRFKANRPCAVSAGAEAAAMVDSADLKIERLLVRNEPFRVRNAYFFAFIFSCSSCCCCVVVFGQSSAPGYPGHPLVVGRGM